MRRDPKESSRISYLSLPFCRAYVGIVHLFRVWSQPIELPGSSAMQTRVRSMCIMSGMRWTCLGCKLETGEGLAQVCLQGTNHDEHESFGVSSEREL